MTKAATRPAAAAAAETVRRKRSEPGEGEEVGARLMIVYPPSLRSAVVLVAPRVVLGRRPELGPCAIEHPTVSRRHFLLEWNAERRAFLGCDLGSSNGSHVDGEEAGEEPLPVVDGAVIRVGDVLLVYERSGGVAGDDPPEVSREAVPGEAAATRELRARLAEAGPDPSPVLIIGETGTGKEFLARELHRLSARAGPFLAVNCAALSPQLIESQLFGHARGAFTGAQSAQPGLFRAAEGGTLLLDEVGELPPDLQPKLLRAIEQGEVLGVGETRPVKANVRVLAATLREIGEAAAFRPDLYARLSLWEIRVPALRQRRADVLLWVERLHRRWHDERFGSDSAWCPPELDADAAERLLLCAWPDNLRGIDRLAHRIGARRPGDVIGAPELGAWLERKGDARSEHAPASPAPGSPTSGRAAALARPTKDEIVAALQACGGSVRAAAKQLGRDRRQLYRWLEQYGLKGSL
ncbi:MAG: sigma 54-interacting transcriptional regulator [Deltaproteobacteria bacterium]|nr:sigma 54-interacting transcriptional regulator [Deltaproteobacteria bacterium]